MAHLNNNVYLNMDLSSIKNDITLLKHKSKNQDDLVNGLNSFIMDSKKIIGSVNSNISTQIESKMQIFNKMIIDTISELQSLKQKVDYIDSHFKDIEKKVEEHNQKTVEIEENKIIEAQSVIEFLESMDFKDKYMEIVLNLGCKDKQDLSFFKEEELVNNGFLLLHARKILSILSSAEQ